MCNKQYPLCPCRQSSCSSRWISNFVFIDNPNPSRKHYMDEYEHLNVRIVCPNTITIMRMTELTLTGKRYSGNDGHSEKR